MGLTRFDIYAYNQLRNYDLTALAEPFEREDYDTFFSELVEFTGHQTGTDVYCRSNVAQFRDPNSCSDIRATLVNWGNCIVVQTPLGSTNVELKKYHKLHSYIFAVHLAAGFAEYHPQFTGAVAQDFSQIDGDRIDVYNIGMKELESLDGIRPASSEGCIPDPSVIEVAELPLEEHRKLVEQVEHLAATSLNTYQHKALKYKKFPEEHSLTYPALGLNGEAGEVAEKVKKIIRDKGGKLDDVDRTELIKELGDVLWYTAILADALGAPLAQVASGNIAKLEDRYRRNKIGGSGDNR